MAGRVAVLLLVTVLAATCSGSPAAARGRIAPAASISPQLQWIECGDGFQCAALGVPLDYSRPRGRKISLALIRKPATDQSRRIAVTCVDGSQLDSYLALDTVLDDPKEKQDFIQAINVPYENPR